MWLFVRYDLGYPEAETLDKRKTGVACGHRRNRPRVYRLEMLSSGDVSVEPNAVRVDPEFRGSAPERRFHWPFAHEMQSRALHRVGCQSGEGGEEQVWAFRFHQPSDGDEPINRILRRVCWRDISPTIDGVRGGEGRDFRLASTEA